MAVTGSSQLGRGTKLVGAITFTGGGDSLRGIDTGTVAIDPGNIAATTRVGTTFTLTGAAAGDMIHMQPPAGLDDDLIFAGAEVTADDTVTVYLYNPTGTGIDDASATWRYIWLDLT